MPEKWKTLISDYLSTEHARELFIRVQDEYHKNKVCPPSDKLFSAMTFFDPEDTKVVILGQDPYFNLGQAVGMSFSVPRFEDRPEGFKFPPSLQNIITEIKTECGSCAVEDGDLTPWAKQGVLLLNTCLTVRLGASFSHANLGWDKLTGAIISKLAEQGKIVFILWGAHAGKYREIIQSANPDNCVLVSAHPSPLSASKGFFGNNHFMLTNKYLKRVEKCEIVW